MNNQTKEILWNLINSFLAGLLVLLGALTDGKITSEGFIMACVAGLAVACTQFKSYWSGEKTEYTGTKLFKFV